MQPEILTWSSWSEPVKAPLPILVEDEGDDDALAVPFPPPVLEPDDLDLPEAPEPWEEAPTQKIELALVSPSYTHEPLTLAPAVDVPGFGLDVAHIQQASSWSGCILPLLGVLTLPFLIWLVQVLLWGRIPAYVSWWVLEQSR